MTNQDMDPSADPAVDPIPGPAAGAEESPAGPSGSNGGPTASAFYDADCPPFEELPEQPRRPPAPEGDPAAAAPAEAGLPCSRPALLGLGAAAAALLALLLVARRRARCGRDSSRARGRRS